MTQTRPQSHRHLAVAAVGVTIAFGAATVAGQIVFRDRFGAVSAEAADSRGTATRLTAAIADTSTTSAAEIRRATSQLSAQAQAGAGLVAVNLPSPADVRREATAAVDDAKQRAGQAAQAAVQEQWDKAKASTAAAALEAATTAGSRVVGQEAVEELTSTVARRQYREVGTASVSLWQSLWEAFLSLWQAFLGLFRK